MNDQSYVCLGTCHAHISKQQHDEGLVVCGAENCTMKGQLFIEGSKCDKCGATYKLGTNHTCQQ